MARLIVLGNGFDRNYNLPTDYTKNLRPILEKNDSEIFEVMDKLYFDSDIDYWSRFEEEIGSIKTIDFVHEGMTDNLDKLYSVDIYDFPPEHNLYGDSYTAVDNAIYEASQYRIDFVEHFKERLEDIFGEIPKFIEDGFVEMAQKSDEKLREGDSTLDKDFNFTESDYFLTFNYTSTLEILYPNIPKENIYHIHGSVLGNTDLLFGNQKSNLAQKFSEFIYENPEHEVGEGREAETSNYADFIDTVTYGSEEFDEYNNYVDDSVDQLNQQMLKETQTNGLANFISTKPITEIYIFGLSMGEVDRIYFEQLNVFFPKVKWFVSFYKNKETDIAVENTELLSFYNEEKIEFIETDDFKEALK